MTNPDNIIRLHSRAGGRSSIYEANAAFQPYSTGILSGSGVTQNTSPDMNIIVGGATDDLVAASASSPDIIIGQTAQGVKVMMDIVGTTVLQVTKPAANKRITSVVVYANDLSATSTDASVTGSPAQNGIILVNGAASSSPQAPSDSDIRAAITADGGTGTSAVYAVIATMTISSSTTTITDDIINRQHSYLNNSVVYSEVSNVNATAGATIIDLGIVRAGSYILLSQAITSGNQWFEVRCNGSKIGYTLVSDNGRPGAHIGVVNIAGGRVSLVSTSTNSATVYGATVVLIPIA